MATATATDSIAQQPTRNSCSSQKFSQLAAASWMERNLGGSLDLGRRTISPNAPPKTACLKTTATAKLWAAKMDTRYLLYTRAAISYSKFVFSNFLASSEISCITRPFQEKKWRKNVCRMLLGCCALSMQVSMLGPLFVGTDDVCCLHPHKIPQAWTFDVSYAPWHWRCQLWWHQQFGRWCQHSFQPEDSANENFTLLASNIWLLFYMQVMLQKSNLIRYCFVV